MTGGGSDANFTSAMGVPTLDGLGADGDGAHRCMVHPGVDAGAAAEVLGIAVEGIGVKAPKRYALPLTLPSSGHAGGPAGQIRGIVADKTGLKPKT